MTMGPEILAWIDEAGGLMKWSPEYGCAEAMKGSGSASLRGHFDLDLHLGLVEPGNDEQRRGGTDIAEIFAADREHRVGIAGIGDEIGRADDIGHRETAVLQRGFDGLEAVPCL